MNKRFILITALFLLILFQGCVTTYLQQVNANINRNFNSFPAHAKLENDSITYYEKTGSGYTVIKNDIESDCIYGFCYYFMCRNVSGFSSSSQFFSTNPYYWLYGTNLTGGNCFVASISSNNPTTEENFKKAYHKQGANYSIQRLGVSQGATFYEANDANPSCKNYIKYPIFIIRGLPDKGYRVSPLIKKSVRCYTEKNAIPVFIFSSVGGLVPKNDNTEEIVRWIASLNSTSIVFTEANPATSHDNIIRIKDQLHTIYKECSEDNPIIFPQTKIKCIPGISIPFNGKNIQDSIDFFENVKQEYIYSYGTTSTGTGFYDISPVVGYFLVSKNSSLCNGFSLISDALKLAKRFSSYKETNLEVRAYPVFLQGLVFVDDANCKFNRVLKQQTYLAIYQYSINAFADFGIINIPTKVFYKGTGIFSGEDYWATKPNNEITPASEEEYSYFYSYCQEYYDKINYPRIVFRNGVGSRECPLKERIAIKYERPERSFNPEMDALFKVNPLTGEHIYNPVYRCDTCFSYQDPDVFLYGFSDGTFFEPDCEIDPASTTNKFAALFAVDPDLMKAIGFVETTEIFGSSGTCNLYFTKESDNSCNPQNIGIDELSTYLSDAGCIIFNEDYFYDEDLEQCLPESSFSDTSGLERCKPCSYGYMNTTFYPGEIYEIYGLPTPYEVEICGNTSYNPFIKTYNACAASAKLAKDIKEAEDFVTTNYNELDIDNSNEGNATIAYFTAYFYKYGDSAGYYYLDLFNDVKSIHDSKDCGIGNDEAKRLCCKEKSDGSLEYKPANEYCCTDKIEDFITKCDRESPGYALSVIQNYKSALKTCKLCYNEEWGVNACEYAKEITGSDICNGYPPVKTLNPYERDVSTEEMRESLIENDQ